MTLGNRFVGHVLRFTSRYGPPLEHISYRKPRNEPVLSIRDRFKIISANENLDLTFIAGYNLDDPWKPVRRGCASVYKQAWTPSKTYFIQKTKE